MVTWSGSFTTSVSDVSSRLFPNSVTIFGFKRGLGFSPLVPVIGNLATFLFNFLAWRAFLALLILFRLLRAILRAIGILTCAAIFEQLTVCLAVVWQSSPFRAFPRITLVFGKGVSTRVGCANILQLFIFTCLVSQFSSPTPLCDCYLRRFVSPFLGFGFHWCFPVQTCTGSALLPGTLHSKQWSGFLVRQSCADTPSGL